MKTVPSRSARPSPSRSRREENGAAGHALRWRLLPLLAVGALAAIGFVVFIPTAHVDESRLSTLVVHQSEIPRLSAKPESSSPLSLSAIQFPAMKDAAIHQPHETGGWSVLWGGSKTNIGDYGELLVGELPSPADARAVQANMDSTYLKPSSWSSQSLTRTSTFVVASLPGSRGAVFSKAGTKKSAGAYLSTITFTFDRVAVLEFLELPTPSRAEATALGERELAQLHRVEPTFSLESTVVPFLSSFVYWIVAAAVVGAMVLVPLAVGRARNRRKTRARYQYHARGAKHLKRAR